MAAYQPCLIRSLVRIAIRDVPLFVMETQLLLLSLHLPYMLTIDWLWISSALFVFRDPACLLLTLERVMQVPLRSSRLSKLL